MLDVMLRYKQIEIWDSHNICSSTKRCKIGVRLSAYTPPLWGGGVWSHIINFSLFGGWLINRFKIMLYIYSENLKAKALLKAEGAKLTLTTKSTFSGLYNEYGTPIFFQKSIYKVEMPYKCSNAEFHWLLASNGALQRQGETVKKIDSIIESMDKQLLFMSDINDKGLQQYVANQLKAIVDCYEERIWGM